MNNSLIYLACPYSHPDLNVRKERFRIANQVTGKLMNEGHFVFSPISMSHPVAMDASLPGDWHFWKAFDTAMLARCQKVIVIDIDGLCVSVGVKEEIRLAKQLGLPIEYVLPGEGPLRRSVKPLRLPPEANPTNTDSGGFHQ